MCNEQRCHLRLVHPDSHPIAGDSRLRNFEESAANPVAIADTYRLIRQPIDREVFPELPVDEIASTKLLLPIAIGVNLIDKNGSVFATMPSQISLSVADNVEPAYHASTLNRLLPYGGMDGLPRHEMSRGKPTFTESKCAIVFFIPRSLSPTHLTKRALKDHARTCYCRTMHKCAQ